MSDILHKVKHQHKQSAHKLHIVASRERVYSIGEAVKLASKKKWKLVKYTSLVMDRKFIEGHDNTMLVLDSTGAPKTIGLHILDRNSEPSVYSGVLKPKYKAHNSPSEWHEHIIVTPGASDAIKRGDPVAMEISSNGSIKKGLVIYSFAYKARIARIFHPHASDGITIPRIYEALRS